MEVGIELVESRWVVEVRHQGGRSEGKDVGRKLAGPGRSNYNNRERREEYWIPKILILSSCELISYFGLMHVRLFLHLRPGGFAFTGISS